MGKTALQTHCRAMIVEIRGTPAIIPSVVNRSGLRQSRRKQPAASTKARSKKRKAARNEQSECRCKGHCVRACRGKRSIDGMRPFVLRSHISHRSQNDSLYDSPSLVAGCSLSVADLLGPKLGPRHAIRRVKGEGK